jgi:hypothetical protein
MRRSVEGVHVSGGIANQSESDCGWIGTGVLALKAANIVPLNRFAASEPFNQPKFKTKFPPN